MNARQKAKKLKKELDYIKGHTFRNYKVINIESEHLRAYRSIPINVIERMGEEVVENEVIHQLSIDFARIIREKMILNKETDLDRFHTMKYSTDIWVGFGRRMKNDKNEAIQALYKESEK